MAIYEIMSDRIEPIGPTTFGQAGVKERQDLQRLLRQRIDIIAPDTLVIAEEFGEWDKSMGWIDVPCVNRHANSAMCYPKRVYFGGHKEPRQSPAPPVVMSTATW